MQGIRHKACKAQSANSRAPEAVESSANKARTFQHRKLQRKAMQGLLVLCYQTCCFSQLVSLFPLLLILTGGDHGIET